MTTVDDAALLAGLDHVGQAPSDTGVLEMIVRRPAVDQRDVVATGELTVEDGLAGDTWRQRGSKHTPDGSAELGRQLTVMNARAIALFAGARERWPLAGDQLYVDFDISVDNLPARTRVRIGSTIIEVSEEPHTGCAKFTERFGIDVSRLINTEEGRRLRLRGMNARVLEPGAIRTGDAVSVIA